MDHQRGGKGGNVATLRVISRLLAPVSNRAEQNSKSPILGLAFLRTPVRAMPPAVTDPMLHMILLP